MNDHEQLDYSWGSLELGTYSLTNGEETYVAPPVWVDNDPRFLGTTLVTPFSLGVGPSGPSHRPEHRLSPHTKKRVGPTGRQSSVPL